MKKLYIIIVVLLIALPTQLWAEGVETMSLYGVVRDAATDAPVPWATVVIKDTTTGTTTNAEGVYEIRAKEGDVLVINCLGYEVRRVTVAKNNHINIKLKQDAIQMDEIVAVGYGKMRKSDLTGATSRVTEADFAQQSTPTDMASMLEGRMAGVNISAGEGGPNPSYSIQIRGASSVGASTQPLYVVDGFPIETSSLSEPSDGFNTTDSSPLSNIDPSNIESIEVLKDASATAIYGSRGANGVVLITTKSGKTGRAVVTYSAQVGISQVTKTVDLLDSEGFAEFMWHRSFTESDPYTAEKEAIASGDTRDYYNYKTYADSTNTDWQKEIYRTAISQSHNLSVSGGTEKSRYYVGAGYLKNEGVIQNNDFTRYSFNAKVNSELKKWLTADFNTTFGYTQSNGVATGVGGNTSSTGVIMQTLRCSPLKSPSDNIDWTMIDSESDDDVAEASTPLTFVNDVTNKKNSTRILANLALTAKLLPGLTFKNSIGTNHNLMNFESFYPSTTSKGSKSNGIASRTYQDQRSWVYEGVFNYNKSFSPKSRLGATAAFTAEENYTSEFSATNENYLYQGLGVDNMSMGTDPSDPSTSKSKSSLSSVLGRVNYTHNNKYLMTISGRADGSSRFPTGNKWAMFPSAALAWRASEEDFLKSIKQISNVKVRASYGVTGNQAIDNYATIATLGTNNYIFNNTVTSGLSLSKISNSDLRWESTRQFDAGVDIGLFGN
ncbi:MAG: SusC/RagA family TonB-linked outer membrane protein, partial [Rikenellaceae bacterium]